MSPSAYTIRVEAKGFRAHERKNNVVLAAGRLAVGSLQLEVGSLAESVTVTAQGQEVATTTTSHQAVIDNKQVALISLRGRDPVSLLRILPGVQQGVDTDQFGGAFSVPVPEFQGRGGNTLYVDGVNGGDGGGGGNFSGATNIDAIAEVNVQMGAYTAEYGLKGGTQVNFITKRGGEQYHGTAYWYVRNEFFNANTWLGNHTSLPNGVRRPVYRFSTQGGNIGGPVPVKIPVLNPKGNQMFFFYSLDDTQMKEPASIRQWTLPSMLERQGDFSQSAAKPKDPLNNNAAFPGNVIPADRRNAASGAMMNLFPVPNAQGSAGYNFIIQEASLDHPRRQHLYRFDLRPTDKDSFSIKHQTWYTKSAGIEVAGRASTWGVLPARYDFTMDIANLSYTRIISPSMVNEFSMGVFYSTESGPPKDEAALKAIQRSTYPEINALKQYAPQNNPLGTIPWITVGSVPGASYEGRSAFDGNSRSGLLWYDGRFPLTGADTAFPVSNNLTYMRGAHSFKFGAMREQERFGQGRSGTFPGQFGFDHNANDAGSTGYAYANMYIGHVFNYRESLGRVPNNRYQATWAFFAQDTWKVSRRLTLDLGLRFYKWTPPLNGGGEASAFTYDRYDPTWGGKPPVLFQPTSTAQGRRALNPLNQQILPANFIGLIVPGTGYTCGDPITPQNPCKINGIVTQNDPTYLGGKPGFFDPLPLQWDPRFGMAWDVFGDGKMAVRASVGVYHDATGGALTEGGPAFNFLKDIYFTDMNSYLTGTSATSVTSVAGPRKTGQKRPVTYNYTLGVQRELGWHTVLDVAYVGSKTYHNSRDWNFNALQAGVRFLPSSLDATNSNKPLPDQFLRPFVGFNDININMPATTSRYDSVQAQVNRRFVGGVELAGTFTYAGGTSNGWNQNNPLPSSAARSRSMNVQQLVFNLSYVIDIPGGSKLIKVPASKWVLDNWQFSGITTFANGGLSDIGTGSNLTSDNFDFSGGGESCGVIQTGDAKLVRGDRTDQRWFNTSVFQRPTGKGDLGNNCNNAKFRLPGFNNHDWSLFKNFPVREGKVLQLRWELYNTFNHTQYSTVDNNPKFNTAGVASSTFGKVTNARTERRMQLSLRFNF